MALSKIDRIASDGVDITSHYLNPENEAFKIFRFNQEVYAVRYDETGPIDYISMWKSHKGENISKAKIIGHGEEGTVYGKTPDKAMKVSKGKGGTQEHAAEINLDILKQQFFLQEKNIAQYFVLGLWNIKTQENVHFYMPKKETVGFSKVADKPKFEEFILALKEMNDSGYWHPDLSNHLYHISFQNLLTTAECMTAIDLDRGFAHNYGDLDSKRVVWGRDQWLYVYNHLYPPVDEFGDKLNWQGGIEQWYEQNEGESLSDHPEALFKFYNDGFLSLPKKIVNDLHKNLSNYGVDEYLSGKVKERKHAREIPIHHFFSNQKNKDEYEGLKGDALKRAIINKLKDSLSNITDPEELKTKKMDFLKSDEMKILDEPQGKPTKVLGALGLKTDSHKAVEKIFKEAEKRINDAELTNQINKKI